MLLQTRLIFSYKPQKNHSAFFWGWMADYVEKVCYYFTHWDGSTIHLYWCQYCETKKTCRSICFCSTYHFLRQKKASHNHSIRYSSYEMDSTLWPSLNKKVHRNSFFREINCSTAVDFRGCILYIFWLLVLKRAGRGKNFFWKIFY